MRTPHGRGLYRLTLAGLALSAYSALVPPAPWLEWGDGIQRLIFGSACLWALWDDYRHHE